MPLRIPLNSIVIINTIILVWVMRSHESRNRPPISIVNFKILMNLDITLAVGIIFLDNKYMRVSCFRFRCRLLLRNVTFVQSETFVRLIIEWEEMGKWTFPVCRRLRLAPGVEKYGEWGREREDLKDLFFFV